MPPVGFEPTVSAGERPQTYALDRAATGTGKCKEVLNQMKRHAINCLGVEVLVHPFLNPAMIRGKGISFRFWSLYSPR